MSLLPSRFTHDCACLSLLSASTSTCCHKALHCAPQPAHLCSRCRARCTRFSPSSRVLGVWGMVPNGASILLGVVAILWLVLINSPLGYGTILLLVVFNFIL